MNNNSNNQINAIFNKKAEEKPEKTTKIIKNVEKLMNSFKENDFQDY